jgi:hypothetical protein
MLTEIRTPAKEDAVAANNRVPVTTNLRTRPKDRIYYLGELARAEQPPPLTLNKPEQQLVLRTPMETRNP